jgi:osmotically-inducible protein OsmY
MRSRLMMFALVMALAIPSAFGQQSGAQTTAQTTSTDSALQATVQSKLSADASFKNVTASVQGGVVELSGTVPSQPEQIRAKEMVSKISGVKSVNEHLSIGEAAAAAATEGATTVPQTAQSESTKNTAGSIAGNSGVIGATAGATQAQPAAGNTAPASTAEQGSQTQGSQTSASPNASSVPNGGSSWRTPDVDSNTLRSEIDSALKSDPSLGNSQLSVDVNDTQITVSGSVPSGKEKQTAIRIVQSYAGNRRVNEKVSLAGKQTPPNSQTPNSMANPK